MEKPRINRRDAAALAASLRAVVGFLDAAATDSDAISDVVDLDDAEGRCSALEKRDVIPFSLRLFDVLEDATHAQRERAFEAQQRERLKAEAIKRAADKAASDFDAFVAERG